MDIVSTAIDAKGEILADYTADGRNVNPPVTFSQIPDGTQSLVFMISDPDAPGGTFYHWVLYNMPAATLQIVEAAAPAGSQVGMNDFGAVGYGGPQPPSGIHHYHFTIYALDAILELPEGADHTVVASAMEGHVIEQCETVGTYAARS